MADPECYSQFTILVCGRAGVGKSTLINEIFGVNTGGRDEESSDEIRDDLDGFEHVAREVTATCKSLNGVLLTMYDSPGLQDGTGNDGKYLQDIRNYYDSVDLVLYCVDFLSDRWLEQENRAIALFSEEFGSSFWENTIVVFTKANRVQNDLRRRAGYESKLEKRFQSYAKKTRNNLTLNKILPDITKRLPFVAAGLKETRNLVYVSERLKVQPCGADYLAELWVMCISCVKLRGSSFLSAYLLATYFGARRVLDPTQFIEVSRLLIAVTDEQRHKDETLKVKDWVDAEIDWLSGLIAREVKQSIKDLEVAMEVKKWAEAVIKQLKTQIDHKVEQIISEQGVVEGMNWANTEICKQKNTIFKRLEQKVKEQAKVKLFDLVDVELEQLKMQVAQEVKQKINGQDEGAEMNDWAVNTIQLIKPHIPQIVNEVQEPMEVMIWTSTLMEQLREQTAQKMNLKILVQVVADVKCRVDVELQHLKHQTARAMEQKVKGVQAMEVIKTVNSEIEQLKAQIMDIVDQTIIVHEMAEVKKSADNSIVKLRSQIIQNLRLPFKADKGAEEATSTEIKLEEQSQSAEGLVQLDIKGEDAVNWADSEIKQLKMQIAQEVRQKIRMLVTTWVDSEIHHLREQITQRLQISKEMQEMEDKVKRLVDEKQLARVKQEIKTQEALKGKNFVGKLLQVLKEKSENNIVDHLQVSI